MCRAMSSYLQETGNLRRKKLIAHRCVIELNNNAWYDARNYNKCAYKN